MSPTHDEHDPGGDPGLRRLLADAVDDIEPGHGLARIRERTKVTPMSNRRPWLYALTAAVATAAVIAAVALAGGALTDGEEDPGPAAATSEETAGAEDSPAPEPSATEEPTQPGQPGTMTTVPVYYLGEGPGGPALFREFHRVELSDSAAAARGSAQEAVSGTPLDPDYRSAWPASVTVEEVVVDGDVARVELSEAVRERPAGLSEREAELAVQQVVYSVQGALQERTPVQLTVDGQPVDQVLGVPTAEPLANAPVLETLSLMNITTPMEGGTVSGTFEATGVNNSFEATVAWEVLDADGTVVADGFGTAEGYMAEQLFPWSVQVDVSGLAPGEYTFVARNDDPTGGAEGNGPASDDKAIVVE